MNKGTLDIEGVIGWDVTARSVKRELRDMGEVDEIDVFLNSPGGYIDDGFGIFSAIKNHEATINVHVTGMAASMGSVIMMAGDKISIEEIGMVMIHPPAGICWGTAAKMRTEADVLDKYENRIVKAYQRQDLNLSDDELRDAIAETTWYTAEEALEAGFVQAVTDGMESSSSEPSNSSIEWLRVARYANLPDHIQKKLKPNNTSKAKTQALVNQLTQGGSAAETATEEGEAMSKDAKKYSEAELEAKVNEAKASSSTDPKNDDGVLAAMMDHPNATMPLIRKARDMGLDAEQAGKFFDFQAENASAPAAQPANSAGPQGGDPDPAPAAGNTAAMSKDQLLAGLASYVAANGQLEGVNLTPGSAEPQNVVDDEEEEQPDPAELFAKLKNPNAGVLQ